MKKFISVILTIIMATGLSACNNNLNEKEIKEQSAVKSFKRLLNNFNGRLNEDYTAYVVMQRSHIDDSDSEIIPNYKLGYIYTRYDDLNFVHDIYNYKLNKYANDILKNIEIVDKGEVYYYNTDKLFDDTDNIEKTDNIFELDTLTDKYMEKYVLDLKTKKDIKFGVYQSVLCDDTLRRKIIKLNESDIDCIEYDEGREYYKSDEDRFEYEIICDEVGWHYSETDNLTGLEDTYLVQFKTNGLG